MAVRALEYVGYEIGLRGVVNCCNRELELVRELCDKSVRPYGDTREAKKDTHTDEIVQVNGFIAVRLDLDLSAQDIDKHLPL